MGYHVFAGCLAPDREGAKSLKDAASDRLHIVPIDVTDDFQVLQAVKYVKDHIGENRTFNDLFFKDHFFCLRNNYFFLVNVQLKIDNPVRLITLSTIICKSSFLKRCYVLFISKHASIVFVYT